MSSSFGSLTRLGEVCDEDLRFLVTVDDGVVAPLRPHRGLGCRGLSQSPRMSRLTLFTSASSLPGTRGRASRSSQSGGRAAVSGGVAPASPSAGGRVPTRPSGFTLVKGGVSTGRRDGPHRTRWSWWVLLHLNGAFGLLLRSLGYRFTARRRRARCRRPDSSRPPTISCSRSMAAGRGRSVGEVACRRRARRRDYAPPLTAGADRQEPFRLVLDGNARRVR